MPPFLLSALGFLYLVILAHALLFEHVIQTIGLALFLVIALLVYRQQRQAQSELTELVTLCPDPIMVIDKNADIMQCNHAAAAMFGYQKDDLIGHNVANFIPDHEKPHFQSIQKLFLESEGDTALRKELDIQTYEGRIVPCEIHLLVVVTKTQRYTTVSLRDVTMQRQQARALLKSESRYRTIFEQNGVALLHVGLDGQFINANKRFSELTGFNWDELKEMTFQQITHPDDLETDLANVSALLEGRIQSYQLEKRYICKDKRVIWVRLTVTLQRNEKKQAEYFISTVDDITAQIKAQQELAVSERKFRGMIEALSDVMVVWLSRPETTGIEYVNQGYPVIFGRSKQSLYDNAFSYMDLVHKEDKERVLGAKKDVNDGRWEVEYRICREDGQLRYIRDVGFCTLNEDGKPEYIVGIAIDKTHDFEQQNLLDDSLLRLQEAYEQLEYSAERDGLTNLYNRGAIFKRITEEFNAAKRYERPASLLFIDLDKFKQFNDTFGHHAGDDVLIAIARFLEKTVRETDHVGRYGGDEFVILLPHTDEQAAKELVERLLETSLNVTLADKSRHSVAFSVGLNTLSKDIKTVKEWLIRADENMYQHKPHSN